jgi:hypothetical protein
MSFLNNGQTDRAGNLLQIPDRRQMKDGTRGNAAAVSQG